MCHAERLMDNVEWGLTEYSELCPVFGMVELELERVYVDSRLERVGGTGDGVEVEYDSEFHNYESEGDNNEGEEEARAVPELCVLDKQMVIEFECPICYETHETGAEGVRTMCGHEYCSPCFWSMVERKSECGMCRSVIREYVELKVV
jgi:hypothetical protein